MQVYANRRLLTFYIMKETIEPNASEENESQEINPSIWKEKISEDLEKLKMMEHPTKEKIANMALEDGILARIAPEDDRVREKRKEDGRRLRESERNDPELYFRIAYALQRSKWTVQENHTLGGGWPTGAIRFLVQTAEIPAVQEELLEDDQRFKDAMIEIVTKMQENVLEMAEERQHDNNSYECNVYSEGTKGEFKGIPVKLKRYTEDGYAWIEAENHKDRNKLYDFTDGNGLTPKQVSQEFVPNETGEDAE
jgi:hypothetical protein